MIWHLYVAWGWYRAVARAGPSTPRREETSHCGFTTRTAEGLGRVRSIVASLRARRKRYRYTFGRDSDLEAFSHNPPDGSFAPSAYQPST
jgi:hypothetical protein